LIKHSLCLKIRRLVSNQWKIIGLGFDSKAPTRSGAEGRASSKSGAERSRCGRRRKGSKETGLFIYKMKERKPNNNSSSSLT
jgi:hypothetical protein